MKLSNPIDFFDRPALAANPKRTRKTQIVPVGQQDGAAWTIRRGLGREWWHAEAPFGMQGESGLHAHSEATREWAERAAREDRLVPCPPDCDCFYDADVE
jgi:hypothetical protein